MNYGKIIDGILRVYACEGDGRKPIKDSVPSGYEKEQCQPVPGSYKEFDDHIGIEYEYVTQGQTLTEQRIENLETAQSTADAALQELILNTLGGEL